MRTPDLHESIEDLRRTSLETLEEITRLIGRLQDSPPATVRALHDAKAHLTYLRLTLRTARDQAAAYPGPATPLPPPPPGYSTPSR